MSTREIHSTTAKAKRRWLQFSLTGLFVGVTLIAGLFLLLQNYVRPYRAQQRATEEIIKFGGRGWWEPAAPQWLPAILGRSIYTCRALIKKNFYRSPTTILCSPVNGLPASPVRSIYTGSSSV